MNYVIYRISSNSQNKDRIQNFNKIDLLVRAIQIFSSFHFIIVADNCNSQLLNKIKTLGQEVIITNLGNAGSAFFCLNYALLRGSVDSIFYFCEEEDNESSHEDDDNGEFSSDSEEYEEFAWFIV